MKKWLSMFMIFTLAAVVLAACGGGGAQQPAEETPAAETPAETPAEEPAKSDIRIGMVTDFGGVNDNSFNQSAWEGLQEFAQTSGVTVDYLQSAQDSDYVPNLNQFIQEQWDLVWGIGFLLQDAMLEVANQNPDAKFAIIDGVVDAPNVASVTFKEHEGSFLVGVVAGLTTKTNKIGFVGGIDIPVIQRFEAGFRAGIAAVNPDAEVIENYTGSFAAADQGKAAAATMYNQGADIIFHAAGATGDGVFNEAQEQKKAGKDVWVIGVDKDQSITFGHEITLTSMMKRVDQAMITVSQSVVDGTFAPGIVSLGIAENGVGLPENNPNVPADVLAKVQEFADKIKSGEIVVPETPAE
ncbi:BMP family ABC transporter substrate-binding protein [Paenibacillus sp.]|uniref:BMP family ABC transporter substrate-binding protein n=1 Tax=Paenibacillus sp. TaxID=58172 RepID=UPI002D61C787|nr:BMP family ABC transporter substrate-binding protein [Paenibacillus sp.]HZG87229.1 BMP family ABC transporter substrate-binding protein [Paenibacillus sp.]